MTDAPKKKSLAKKLRKRYRLVLLNDATFEEVLTFRLSRLNVMAVVSFSVITLIIGVTFLIAFTPLKEYIPGYPDGNTERINVLNAIKLDSLQKELQIRDEYLNNIVAVLSGEAPNDMRKDEDTLQMKKNIKFKVSDEDSVLRKQIEEEEKFNYTSNENRKAKELWALNFFVPLNGVITNSFTPEKNHFAVDIVAPKNEAVKSTLDGVVIFASWTLEFGYVIQVQHANDLVSAYKHNSNLLKKVGDKVKAGEAIAIVGNSGELTTGPHLHFELWHQGKPINPEDYIIF